MHGLSVLALAGLLISCGTPLSANRHVEAPVEGHPELVSASDLQNALHATRLRLSKLAPKAVIFRVTVLSSSRIEVSYWDHWDDTEGDSFLHQNASGTGYLALRRVTSGWRVMPGHGQIPLDVKFIVGLTSRCS